MILSILADQQARGNDNCMKYIFKHFSIDSFIEFVILLVDYCAPVLAGLGFLHLCLCNHHVSFFWKVVLYVMAFTLGILSFLGYEVRKNRVRKLEEDIARYKQE